MEVTTPVQVSETERLVTPVPRANSTSLLLPPLYSLSPVISTPSARDAEVNAAA